MSPKAKLDKTPQKSTTAAKAKSESAGKSTTAVKEKMISTERLEKLLGFDREVLIRDGRKKPTEVIIGTDEVGRGCLAGPVVACAVILPELEHGSELFRELARLNDSKTVPPAVREILAARLKEVCQYAIGEASVDEIDDINILHASLLAMKRAVRRLKVTDQVVILIDGNKRIESIKNIEQITVIDGDNKSASIAAASIIAKVHRDTFMRKLAKQFPEYCWDSNKGYQSKDHYAALYQHGMTVWHRKSFNCGVNMLAEDEDTEEDLQLKFNLEVAK